MLFVDWLKYRLSHLLGERDINYVFSRIYRTNSWSSSESRSGKGSEISYTGPLRDWLCEQIPLRQIKSIVDAPCGDFHWIPLVLEQVDVDYVGIDIVSSLIQKNTQLYESPKVKFLSGDLRHAEIPPCDLLIVRDCLFHLSFDDIQKVLHNLDRAKYKYLLTTTHLVSDTHLNSDIRSGGFRLIDLFSPPFNFDSSLIVGRVLDCPDDASVQREMILVKKHDVPVHLL